MLTYLTLSVAIGSRVVLFVGTIKRKGLSMSALLPASKIQIDDILTKVSGTLFTRLYFIRNLCMGPISSSVRLHEVREACQLQTV